MSISREVAISGEVDISGEVAIVERWPLLEVPLYIIYNIYHKGSKSPCWTAFALSKIELGYLPSRMLLWYVVLCFSE